MKILGIRTAYRLTKEKVITSVCVVTVTGLCCIASIAVNALLNYSDVQALRVDPGEVIGYETIPEEYAPDRENSGIKTPEITSDTKAAQKLNSAGMNEADPDEEDKTSEPEPSEEPTETFDSREPSEEPVETEEDEPEETTKAAETSKITSAPKQTSKKVTESAFKKTVLTRAVVNLRKGPGTSYAVVRKVNAWTSVNVVAKTSNGWYKTSDGLYIKQSLTTLATKKATATPKPKTKKTTKTTKKTTKPTTKSTTKKTTVTKVNGVKCKIVFYGPVLYKRKDGSTFYSTTTATGTKCKQGRTVAADWSIFPKKSKIYIENDPLGGDGIYIVEDKGRFTGNMIDIYVDNPKAFKNCSRMVYKQ